MKKTICILIVFILVTLSACTGHGNGKSREVGGNAGDHQQTGITEETNTKEDKAAENDETAKNNKSGEGNTEEEQIPDLGEIISDESLKPEEMLDFIRENIDKASADEAAKLLLRLEQLQQNNLEEMTNRYAETESMQSELWSQVYNYDTGEISFELIKDPSLKELLTDAQNNGYRTATAEGSFFPVIDYSIYKEFGDKLPEDLESYFSLMAAESGRSPASDGGLVIGWDEVFERALNQQQFIMNYSDSIKINEAKELYKKFVIFIFSGENIPNTPHFDYSKKTLSPRLKESLLAIAEKAGDTPLERMIKDYAEVLDKNGYKLTDEVKKFRENAVASLCN
ncbi:MAG: hypothetical protein ACOX4M_04985 [Acetivibrionales bacterium]|jgi:hypothetical protein